MTKTEKTKKNIVTRPPVIAVMGHIDHGKSTLLDYIRKTNVTEKEAGGITQRIAAYEVIHKTKNGNKGEEHKITFLDTPGHSAFKGIRVRGARVADIAILVVSGEEGVKPQTIEALHSIKEAGIPYIVAINKIDSPKADIERTRQSLAESEIYIEGYGGDIPWVAVSAKTGEGISDLLDMMLLVAEVQELKGDTSKNAEGILLEANLETKKGISASLIIKDGTLKTGMYVISGESMAPVRVMENFIGERITEAQCGSPVKVIGFNFLPTIGELFSSYATKKEAEEAILKMTEDIQKKVKLEKAQIHKTQLKENDEKVILPLIIKTDTAGTLEAIENELKKINTEKITLRIVHKGVGDISENDLKGAVGESLVRVIGFNVKADNQAKAFAERLAIEIHVFDIIYKLIEWLQEILINQTPKVLKEEVSGKAKILKIFSKNKDKQVVGGKVIEGIIAIGEEIKIMRRDIEIGKGKIKELQQQKEKAKEIKKDIEFGTMIESKIEIAPGDKIEAFKIIST
jgi:translation initiation factor IF-2